MKITLKNDFHNTKVTLISKDGMLSEGQMKRAKRELCCKGCMCSGEFGYRGPQEIDGIEPIYDSRVGRVTGGLVHFLDEE